VRLGESNVLSIDHISQSSSSIASSRRTLDLGQKPAKIFLFLHLSIMSSITFESPIALEILNGFFENNQFVKGYV
jgi:hypothetical protein